MTTTAEGESARLSGFGQGDVGTSGLGDGRRVVTTAGTRVALSSTRVSCKWVALVAETDNTGVIVVGSANCVADVATRRGVPLAAGESLVLTVDNLIDVFLDSTVDGDGVTYLYGI